MLGSSFHDMLLGSKVSGHCTQIVCGRQLAILIGGNGEDTKITYPSFLYFTVPLTESIARVIPGRLVVSRKPGADYEPNML